MTGSDIKRLKDKYVKANIICPIMQVVLTKDTAVVDHKHITRKDITDGKTGEDGKGLLRGVIHDQANVFIGKIEKGFVRSGCHKYPLSISDQLRHIADYLEDPPLPQNMIHPNDRVKPQKLTKRDYKKICKYWFEMFPRSRTLPKYPSGVGKKKIRYMTPKWVTWLNMADELSKPKNKRKIKRVK
jgi:hypothetical protein